MRIPVRHPHKASGHDRCRLNNKEYWFGPTGSAESDRRYAAWVQELLAGNSDPQADQVVVTVDELVLRFLRFAKARYSSGEYANLKQAARVMLATHATTACNAFGPRALMQVRDDMVAAGWPRVRVNEQAGRLRRIFRWGVQHEFVKVHAALALREVMPLRCGADGEDREPVRPATDAQIAAILPELTPTLAAMVTVQRLVGMRPGELFIMRACDIDRGEDIWVYRPSKYKNKWRGMSLAYALGPKSQAILTPLLDKPADAYLFSPADSIAERNAARVANRTTKPSPSHVARKAATRPRRSADKYNRTSYRNAIARAAHRLAGGDSEKFAAIYFAPNQLRHARATELRAMFGLEQARVALAHADVSTTLIYAEADLTAAKDIARKTG